MENMKNIFKKIVKFVAICYAIDAIATAVALIIYTVVNGTDRTKHLLSTVWAHVKSFYKKLFRGDFRGAAAEYTDNILDQFEDEMSHRYGDGFTASVMSDAYDELEARHIPFTRKGDFMSHPISESEVPEDIRRKAE